MATLRLVPASGNPIEITKDQTVLGRDPACDVVVADGSVSRRHARLERRGAGWAVVDQGSANGTFVDSQRVAEGDLKAGQELRLGAVAFKVDIEGAADLQATIASAPAETLLQAAPPPAPRPAAPPAPVAAPQRPAAPPPPRPSAPPPPPAPAVAPPPRPAAPPPPPPAPRGPSAPTGRPVAPMAAPPLPRKGKGPMVWVLAGCCGCLLLAVAGFLGIFGIAFIGTQPAATAVQAMLADAKAGRLDAAYQRFSSGYQGRVSQAQFAAIVAQHPELGQNAGASFMKRSIENNVATLEGTLATPDKTQVPAVFRLVKEGSAWKIDEMRLSGEAPSAPATSSDEPGSHGTSSGGLAAAVSSLNKRREGDSIKISLDLTVSGFQARSSEEGQVADIIEDVATFAPDGSRLPALSKDGIERYQGAAGPTHTFSTTLTMDPGNSAGTYRVVLTAHDMIGGGKATQEATFEFP